MRLLTRREQVELRKLSEERRDKGVRLLDRVIEEMDRKERKGEK